MKLPKLLGDLSPDAFVGMSKASALEQVDAPYLTASGPGFITRKKNGFLTTTPTAKKPEQAMPYLWSEAATNLPRKTFVADPLKKKIKAAGVDSSSWAPRGVFLNGSALGGIERGGSGTQFRLSAFNPRNMARQQVTEFGDGVPVSLVVSGQSEAGLMWGALAYTPRKFDVMTAPPDSGINLLGIYNEPDYPNSYVFGESVPNVPQYRRNDGVVSSLPAASGANRGYFVSRVFPAGAGKLISLVSPGDLFYGGLFMPPVSVRTTMSSIVPYIAKSTDHGATWDKVDFPQLESLIGRKNVSQSVVPPNPPDGMNDGSSYEGVAEQYAPMNEYNKHYIANSFRSVYIGGNVSLLLVGTIQKTVPDPFASPGADLSIVAWKKQYLFRYADGVVSPLSWDGDMHVSYPADFGEVETCFGPGCCAFACRDMSVIFPTDPAFGYHYRVSYDSGDSWRRVDPPPELFSGISDSYGSATAPPKMVVLRPYLGPDSPGRILLCTPREAFLTDGNFNSFRNLGRYVPIDVQAQAVTWFYRRKHLYPELPDEY